MLAIAPETMALLEAASWPGFVEETRETLADKYPHLLPRFPPAIQTRIVGNMLGRARLYGLRLQSGLVAFCEFMIAVAPNFDQEPEVRAAMDARQADLDRAMPSLGRIVPAAAWDRAEAALSNLPLFVAPGSLGQPLQRRTAEAVALALADRPEGAAAEQAVARAVPVAQSLGIAAIEDGVLVTTACNAFFGEHGWAGAVKAEGWAPAATVEAMRLRIALGFGRFI